MIFYLALMLGFVGLGRLFDVESNAKKRKAYVIAATAVIILLAALRSESIGSDTPQYCFVYPRIAKRSLWYSLSNERYEAGYVVLLKLLSVFGDNPRVLLVFTSVFIFSVMGYSIYKNSSDVAMSFALMVGLSLFGFFVSIMRQALAMAIIMLAVEWFLKKNRRLAFLVCVLLAATFHTSALVAVLMLLPTIKRFDLGALTACIFVGVAGTALSRAFFEIITSVVGKYADYMSTGYFAPNVSGAIIQTCVCGGITLLSLMYIPIWKRSYGYNEYAGSEYIITPPEAEPLPDILNLFLWFVGVDLAITVMCSQLLVYDRLRYYFECYTISLLPWALMQEKRQNIRFLLQVLVLIAAMLYFVLINTLRPMWSSIIPYRFFFK